MSELKPIECECGLSPGVRYSTKRENPRWRVECHCGVCGPYDHLTQDGAIIRWNTRPAVPVEDLKRLKESANDTAVWSGEPPLSWWNYHLDELIDQAEKDHES